MSSNPRRIPTAPPERLPRNAAAAAASSFDPAMYTGRLLARSSRPTSPVLAASPRPIAVAFPRNTAAVDGPRAFSASYGTPRLSRRNPMSGTPPTRVPEDVSREIVRRHLASTAPSDTQQTTEAVGVYDPDYQKVGSVPGDIDTVRYQRPGADTTYDIYKWANQGPHHRRYDSSDAYDSSNDASRQPQAIRRARSKSIPDLWVARSRSASVRTDDADSSLSTAMHSGAPHASDLLLPGGFRRHHIRQQRGAESVEDEGFTRSFLDFLALYGHFAGDEFLEDWEEDDRASLLLEAEHETRREEGSTARSALAVSTRTPLLPSLTQKSVTPKASTRKVYLLLLKSFIGTGVLFLPRSFHSGGWVFSLIVLCCISLLCLHAMLLLIECRQIVPGSFGDIGGKVYGSRVKKLVRASIFISQIGFSCAYTIFVARNLRDIISLSSGCQFQPSEASLIIAQYVIYAPLALIRKIKHLSVFALIADVFILFGLVYLFAYDVWLLSLHGIGPGVRAVSSGPEMAVFIGTAVFTFEGIGLMIPIVEGMKQPEEFPGVLKRTMFIATAVFCVIGLLSYFAFGSAVETVVLRNLPASDPMVGIIQLLYTLAIVFSVPLQLFPVIGILEHALFRVRSGRLDPTVKWRKNFIRGTVTALMIAVACAGSKSFDRFISIIGSFACVPLSFIYPAMFHYKIVAQTRRQKMADLALACFGVFLMLYVTRITILSWMEGEGEVPRNRCDG